MWRGLLAYFVLYFFVRGFMSGAHGANNFHGAFTDQFILERFWCEFRISLNSHKPVSKAYRPKNDNFYLLMTTLRFPFWRLTLRMRSTRGGDSIFVGKFCPEMCLKINRSVKTPWHRPSSTVTARKCQHASRTAGQQSTWVHLTPPY